MNRKNIHPKQIWLTGLAVLVLAAGLATGCKNQATEQPAARTDQQVSSDIQAKIQGEPALAGQNIQVSVANGVATLSGTAQDEASRALAGNETGSIDGVKTVVNNLAVQPAQQASAAPAAAPVRNKPSPDRASRRDRSDAEQARMTPPPPPTSGPTPVQTQNQAPPPPPEPPKPVVRQITLAAGTVVPIRMTDGLNSKTTQTNDVFHASLAEDIVEQGVVVIPRGSPVLGQVVDAKEAAHFKGNSLLEIQLTQLTARGQKIPLETDTFSTAGAGRGKNTAVKTGGGAALGAIVGAIAGGGKGAAIGALAGGGAGAGINAVTRGEQVQIPTESMLSFRLQSPITVTVTILPSGKVQNPQNDGPQLQHR
jgi:hypothetical protein